MSISDSWVGKLRGFSVPQSSRSSMSPLSALAAVPGPSPQAGSPGDGLLLKTSCTCWSDSWRWV